MNGLKFMNRKYVLFQLGEAKQEIENTISDIENDVAYGYERYIVAMSNIYHHINTAWNARDASKRDTEYYSEEDFYKWRKFPTSDEFLLDE